LRCAYDLGKAVITLLTIQLEDMIRCSRSCWWKTGFNVDAEEDSSAGRLDSMSMMMVMVIYQGRHMVSSTGLGLAAD